MSQGNIEVVQSAYAAISERGFDALADAPMDVANQLR
jgi:hypothetical protein